MPLFSLWTKVSFLIFAVSSIFLIQGLYIPTTQNFDEVHYVKTTRLILQGKDPLNYEHPPLAKWMMALSVNYLGDSPFAWRLPSAISGAITIVAIFNISKYFWGNLSVALAIALLTISNMSFYVQSRIAMLDAPMTALSALGFWMFLQFHQTSKTRPLILMNIFFGLGMACKWFAIVPWALCIAQLLNRFPTRLIFISLAGGAGIAIYYSTFLPYFFLSDSAVSLSKWKFWVAAVKTLIPLQLLAFDLHSKLSEDHAYKSSWWQWPLLVRPIWYHASSDPHVRWVIHLLNPVVAWGGIIAVLGSLKLLLNKTSSRASWPLIAFLVMWLFWAIVPRKLTFSYYYYPASLCLPFVLVEFLIQQKKEKYIWPLVTCSVLLFIFFLPILRGDIVDHRDRDLWIWFRSWI